MERYRETKQNLIAKRDVLAKYISDRRKDFLPIFVGVLGFSIGIGAFINASPIFYLFTNIGNMFFTYAFYKFGIPDSIITSQKYLKNKIENYEQSNKEDENNKNIKSPLEFIQDPKQRIKYACGDVNTYDLIIKDKSNIEVELGAFDSSFYNEYNIEIINSDNIILNSRGSEMNINLKNSDNILVDNPHGSVRVENHYYPCTIGCSFECNTTRLSFGDNNFVWNKKEYMSDKSSVFTFSTECPDINNDKCQSYHEVTINNKTMIIGFSNKPLIDEKNVNNIATESICNDNVKKVAKDLVNILDDISVKTKLQLDDENKFYAKNIALVSDEIDLLKQEKDLYTSNLQALPKEPIIEKVKKFYSR